MPYIKPDRREYLAENAGHPGNEGELNFCLTWHLLHSRIEDLPMAVQTEIDEYIKDRDPSYAFYNSIMGALDCCRREYIRRRGVSTREDRQRVDTLHEASDVFYIGYVAPYEDIKIQENGDCYS